MNSQGFSLIELMIVVAIVGILSATAMPSYRSYVDQAKMTEAMSLAAQIKPHVTAYYAEYGRFPADNDAAGVPAPGKLIGNYVTTVEVANGAIHVTLGNYVGEHMRDKVLSLRPATVDDSPTSPIAWNCGYRAPPRNMSSIGENRTDVDRSALPTTCR